MQISSQELSSIIAEAKTNIRILGVVSLNPDWNSIIENLYSTLVKRSDFSIRILCESSNTIFSKSLTSDSECSNRRFSFKELEFVRNRTIVDLPDILKKNKRFTEEDINKISIKITHLPIPCFVVECDGIIYISEWLYEIPNTYEEIKRSDHRFSKYYSYLDSYFDPTKGGKFAAAPGDELLELYDHYRIPRGIYPRKSFYDTDFSQLVIWGLVFDRKGRILIHRREDNAKDNRSMWDKSVGGHVDFTIDVDTSRAMARELLEELFTDEMKKADRGEIKAWTVIDEDVVYLGEWRPDRRKASPIMEAGEFDKEWSFFRIRKSQQVYSPRTMPDKNIRRLRVIADVYLFLAGPGLTEQSLGELENSTFKLLELAKLKTAMDKALRGEQVVGFEKKKKRPLFSPDLINIMTGELKDTLEEFAQHIKTYL